MSNIRTFFRRVFSPPLDAPSAVVLMRLVVGGIFLSEGILKFVYANQGVGRMAKLGFPFPVFTADFVGTLEIVGGLLFMLGLMTRAIAIPFVIEMIVAIVSTKIGLYFGTSPLAPPPVPPKVGFWAVMHESRADYGQLLTSLFLLVVGPGPWSLDAVLRRMRRPAREGSRGSERRVRSVDAARSAS
ncbi:MAG: DoxX family protein [Polyangiaceae bacterium]|jgi:uncharacterized membrane protein YphA (DoxX/SURF4 family)